MANGIAPQDARITAGNLVARVAAAVPANYGLTSVLTACIARLLPMPPAEASVAATLFSFALFAGIALAAFAVRSVSRLWLWMLVSGAVAGGALWLSLMVGGRL